MNAEYYPITGLEEVYIALGVQDSTDSYSAGVPQMFAPAQNAEWTEEQSSQPIFANNVKQDELFGTAISTVVIRVTGVSEKLDAQIRGKGYDETTGRAIGSGNDTPTLGALGLKINKGESNFVYVWFPKGRFSGGNIVATSKENDVTISTREYTFTAMETAKKYTFFDAITGKSKTTGITWIKGDTTDPAFDGSAWFSQVQTPDTTTPPSALALSLASPLDEATDVEVSANIVLTFNNKISSENVLLLDETSSVVEATKTFDAAGKVLTISPDADLSAGDLYTVVIAGVVDIYGQKLAPATITFTTAES